MFVFHRTASSAFRTEGFSSLCLSNELCGCCCYADVCTRSHNSLNINCVLRLGACVCVCLSGGSNKHIGSAYCRRLADICCMSVYVCSYACVSISIESMCHRHGSLFNGIVCPLPNKSTRTPSMANETKSGLCVQCAPFSFVLYVVIDWTTEREQNQRYTAMCECVSESIHIFPAWMVVYLTVRHVLSISHSHTLSSTGINGKWHKSAPCQSIK